MANYYGTNLVTVATPTVLTGQITTGSHSTDNSVHLSADTRELTHGVFLVVDAGNFHVKFDNTADDSNLATTGVKISANNPLAVNVNSLSGIVLSSTAASKTMTFIAY